MYSKRPLWHWLLLYLVVGLVIYGLVYYFFLMKKGSTSYSQAPSQQAPMTQNYLKAPNGMTLYIFDKDTAGVSTCYNACATLWPPFTLGKTSPDMTNIATVKRTDGSSQYTYNGKPLYFYSPDKQPGDTLGDGVGGVWHLVKL